MDHLRWKTLAEITAEDRSPVFQPVLAPVADTELEEEYTPETWETPGDQFPESEDIFVAPPPPVPAEAPPPPAAVEELVLAESVREETPRKPRHSIAPYVIGLLLLLLFVIATILLLRDEPTPAVGGLDPIEAISSEEGAAFGAEAAAVTERLNAWSNDTRQFLRGAPSELSQAEAQTLEKRYDTLMLDVGALPEAVRADDSVAARLDEAEEIRAALQALRAEVEAPASVDLPVVEAQPTTPPPRRRAERNPRTTPPAQRNAAPSTQAEEPTPAPAEEPSPPVRSPAPMEEEPSGPVKIDDLLRSKRYKVDEAALNDVLKAGYGGVGVIGLEELRRMAAFSKAPLRLARVDETTTAHLPLTTSNPVEAAVLVPNRNGGTTLYLVVENE